MAERTVSVRLVARVDAYTAAMAKASAATGAFSAASQRSLATVGTSMMTIGKRATTWLSLPIAAAGAFAVKAAMDWESAWAGVTKTVDGTAEQMAELEQGFRDMSKELPATHEEIAAVAEAAGALGVAAPDVLEFTRVMIDLGETTNLSAEEAATSIAQLMNVLQTAPEDVDNLASTLVELGNTGASTEGQILDMATRIAGAGAVAGFTAPEILGLAAALADLGIPAELGGTAISRVMSEIGKSVSIGGEKLTAFAEIAGMSASQFASTWEADPMSALVSFIDGLGRIDAAGGSVDVALAEVGLSGTRVGDVLKRVMSSADGLTGAVDRSSAAWDENTALTDEAAKRYETTAARFEMVRNQIVDLFIDLGTMLLPFVESIVNGIGLLAAGFQALPAPLQVAVGGFLALVAAVGPIVFVTGAVMKNLKTLTGLFGLTGGAATTMARSLGLIGIALMGGVAIYGLFTAEQRKTDENTRAATAALDAQFPALMNAAVAATRAGEEINTVALANKMLSEALAEGNEQLADSAAVLNIGASDILDVFALMKADGTALVTTIDYLARSFGLNAEQADFVARSYGMLVSPVQSLRDSTMEAGAALGISREQFEALIPAIGSFFDAADETKMQQMVRDFLNLRVSIEGYEGGLVQAAEEQTGLNRNVDDAIAVYQAYVGLVANASDEQLQAAGITADVEAEIAALGVTVEETGAGFDRWVHKIPPTADQLKNLRLRAEEVTTKLDLLGNRSIAAGDKLAEVAGKALAGSVGLNGFKNVIAAIGDASDSLAPKVAGVGDRASATGDKFGALVEDSLKAAGGFDDLADAGVSVSDAMEGIGAALNAHTMQNLRELSGLQSHEGWLTALGVREIEAFGEALHEVLDPQQEFIRSQDAIWHAGLTFNDSLDEGSLALEDHSLAALTNRAALMDWLDAIEAGADAQLRNGDSIASVNQTLEYNVQALRDAAHAAGLNDDEVNRLIDTYLNVPESVDTAITLSGEKLAMQKIEDMLLGMDVLDEGVIAEVTAIIEADGAWAGYHYLVDYINTHGATVQVSANVNSALNAIYALNGIRIIANVAAGFHAAGGYFDRPTAGVFGEAGPEVILPLSRPAQMASLLDDPRVSGPVMAALGNLTAAGGGGGGGSPRGGGDIIWTGDLIMPPGSDGDDVVRAFRDFQRRRGPIPISTR